MTEVTVLGRGASLIKLNKFTTDSSKVIVCNEFWKTRDTSSNYFNDPTVNNFIKDKDITLIMSPSLQSLEQNFEKKYNVKNKFNCVWKTGSGTHRDRSPLKGWEHMPNDCLSTYKLLEYGEHKSKTFKASFRGTGAWAILLAIDYLKACKVNIFGLDFYEADYFVKQFHDYSIDKTLCEECKHDYTLLFSHWNKVHFNIHTLAEFQPDLPNVSVY